MGFVFAVTLFISGMICGVVGIGALLIWFLNDKTRKIERQIATFPDLGPKNLPKQSPVIIKLPPTVGSAASPTILQDSKQRKLICEVFEATGIVRADNNGTTDPFLKIKLNDQTVKTRTLLNTLTPKWGESFVLLVEDAQTDELKVQLFDRDKPKESLGEISVSLAELVKDHPKDQYLTFQGMASTKQGKIKSEGELRLQLTLVDVSSDLPLSVKSKREKKREKEARARDKDKDKDDKEKEERRKEREERKKKDKEDRRLRMAEKKREEREKKERKREEKRARKEEHSGESESSVRESESSSASLALSRAATNTSLSFVSDLAASSASNTTNKESARALTSRDSARSLSARRDSVNSDAPFNEPSISEDESFASETGSISSRKKHHDVNMAMKGWLEMKRDKTSPRPGSSTKEKLWFVLEGNKLKYFKTAPINDPLPLGVIDLTAAKVRKSRTKKKTFGIEIPVTHSNHVHSPHVTVSPDSQQDPVGKKDVQKRKYQLKAATKAMLDMWVSALQSRGVATVEERRDSKSGADLDVDSDSESAMLTAVTEVSDSDEETSFKSDDEDSQSESSDKIDAVTGIKKEKKLTGSVPNLPLHSKISLLDSAPAMVSQSARALPISSRESDPSLASTESSESRDDLQEAQVEFLEKELKDLDGEDVISESKAKELKIEPLQRVGAEATSGGGGDWLNVFLGRIFRDMQTCQVFLEEIKTKVRDQFEKIPKRTFMGPVVLKNFHFGEQFFKFHNLRFKPTSTPDEVVGEALVTYEKGFGLTAACEFYVNWPKPMTAVIPLEVNVSIKKCIGTWHFRFPPEVNSRMEICFVAPPDIEFDFLITVVGRNTRLGMLPQLRRFLFGLVKKSLTNLFVYPSKLKLFIPLPARRADTVLENPLRQRPRMPASGRTVPSRRDRPDVRARKTIVARFVNEVLNQRRFDQLQDLFTEDCLVHGSSLAGAVHQGRDAVKQHILELQNAFPDLVFYVEDLVADGVNVFIRWLARGTHKGQLWDYPGTGEERLLRGSMMCKVKEGNQRITDMYFYWSLSSVYSLL